MNPIIKAQGVSKKYRIGESRAAYGTLRDKVAAWTSATLQRNGGRTERETLWALKDVSFEVSPGEVVGVVGRNGAGKSTLLKLLSRVTEPTHGHIELYGRIGSLLEVGTGFHPELTGRENVYLYGAILGMPRAEIKRKFDEIVSFSGVERFIDTPVKHYSSGMYMRLAFSVPAHLEPEIMLIDEVLAVGDISFQQKCLERVKRLKERGTAILLVSHNMTVLQGACERAIYLAAGEVAAEGHPSDVVRRYRDDVRRGQQGESGRKSAARRAESEVTLTGFEMFGADGESRRTFQFGEEMRIRISLHAARRIESPVIAFGIRRADGVLACNFNNWFDNFKIDFIEGDCTLEGWLPPLRLVPNYYEIHVLVFRARRSSARGDVSRLRPLASATFDDFIMEGPPITEDDGVFQEPALKWVLTRAGGRIEFSDMHAGSLIEAFGELEQPKGVA
jgi:homopolymeric O-antigen transport system ATP-binding protein